MYLYVELWNVTQKWMDLSNQERADFFEKKGSGMSKLRDQGLEVIGWAMNDELTTYRSDYRYMAVWKLPSEESVKDLERAVADSGWHEYFSQINSRGKIVPMNDVVNGLINLEKTSTSLTD